MRGVSHCYVLDDDGVEDPTKIVGDVSGLLYLQGVGKSAVCEVAVEGLVDVLPSIGGVILGKRERHDLYLDIAACEQCGKLPG